MNKEPPFNIDIHAAREMLREMESDKATIRTLGPKAEAYDFARAILKLATSDRQAEGFSRSYNGYAQLSYKVSDYDHASEAGNGAFPEPLKGEPAVDYKPRRGRPPKAVAKPKRVYTRRNPPPKIKARKGR